MIIYSKPVKLANEYYDKQTTEEGKITYLISYLFSYYDNYGTITTFSGIFNVLFLINLSKF